VYGFRGDSKRLFNALDTGGEDKTLSLKEVSFLDDWVLEEEEQAAHRKTIALEGPIQMTGPRSTIRASLAIPAGSRFSVRHSRASHLFAVGEDMPKMPQKSWQHKVDDPMRLAKVASLMQQKQKRSSVATAGHLISSRRTAGPGAMRLDMQRLEAPKEEDEEEEEDEPGEKPAPRRPTGLPVHAVERKDRERLRVEKEHDHDSVRQLWLNYQSKQSTTALQEALRRGMDYDVTHIGGPLTAREVKMARKSLFLAVAREREQEDEEALETLIEAPFHEVPPAKPSLDELLQIPRVGPEYLLASVHKASKAKLMQAESRVHSRAVSNKSSMARLPSIPKLPLQSLQTPQAGHQQPRLPPMPHTAR